MRRTIGGKEPEALSGRFLEIGGAKDLQTARRQHRFLAIETANLISSIRYR